TILVHAGLVSPAFRHRWVGRAWRVRTRWHTLGTRCCLSLRWCLAAVELVADFLGSLQKLLDSTSTEDCYRFGCVVCVANNPPCIQPRTSLATGNNLCVGISLSHWLLLLGTNGSWSLCTVFANVAESVRQFDSPVHTCRTG